MLLIYKSSKLNFYKRSGVLWDLIFMDLQQQKIMFLSDCELIILWKAKGLWGD